MFVKLGRNRNIVTVVLPFDKEIVWFGEDCDSKAFELKEKKQQERMTL